MDQINVKWRYYFKNQYIGTGFFKPKLQLRGEFALNSKIRE